MEIVKYKKLKQNKHLVNLPKQETPEEFLKKYANSYRVHISKKKTRFL